MRKYMTFKEWLLSIHNVTIEQLTKLQIDVSDKLAKEYWQYVDKCKTESTSN